MGSDLQTYFDQTSARYDEMLECLDFQLDDAYEYVSSFLRHAMRRKNDPAVLELGTGTGTFTEHLLRALPHMSLVGLDLSEQMLAQAAEKFARYANVRLLHGDFGTSIPDNQDFDAVVSSMSFGFYDIDHARVFRNVHKVLTPGGRFVYLANFSHQSASVDDVAARMLHEKCHVSEEQKSWMQSVRGETRYFQAPLSWHLTMLEQAGFFEVECFYMRYQIAGFTARKPIPRGVSHPEHLPG